MQAKYSRSRYAFDVILRIWTDMCFANKEFTKTVEHLIKTYKLASLCLHWQLDKTSKN